MRQREQLLSKREQQIMDVAYARGVVSAADVEAALPDRPSNSTVRTLLRTLEERGRLLRREEGGKYLYSPAEPREAAGTSALRRARDVFFAGSVRDAVAGLLGDAPGLTDEEADALVRMIEEARR